MTPTVETTAPPPRLYTNAAISVGTAVRGPIARAYLLSRNFQALGQHVEARRAHWGGTVLKYQQESIDAHLDVGGKKGRKLAVAGVSIVGLLVTLAIGIPLAAVAPPFDGKHVTLEATGAEVYYDGRATEADALALGLLLERREYFSPGGDRAAQIERRGDGSYNVVLEIERAFWEQPALALQLDGIIRDVEEAVGAPVRVTARSYTVGPPRTSPRCTASA